MLNPSAILREEWPEHAHDALLKSNDIYRSPRSRASIKNLHQIAQCMRAFTAMVLMRTLMVLLMVFYAIRGELGVLAMYLPILLMTLPLVWLGRRDDHYYWLDVAILATFLAALAVNTLIGWPEHHTFYSYDKLLHAAGGAWVAALAAVAFRKRISDRIAFYTFIIAAAVAIGAFWEAFEWALALLPPPWYVESTGLSDAMMDIIIDAVGAAAVAAALAFRRYL